LEIAAEVCGGRIVFVSEGGYSLKGIRECALPLLQVLAGVAAPGPQRVARIKQTPPSRFSTASKVATLHRKYWPGLSA
jgi:acetoin utilization deacetylase AcuC-like enzyme